MLALLIVGGIVAFVGWVMLIIGAFRAGAWWGLAVLVGPIVLAVAVRDIWVNLVANVVLMLIFAVPRLDEVKMALIVYVLGTAISVPGALALVKETEKAVELQAAAEAAKSPKVPRVYTPPVRSMRSVQPVQAAAIPTPPPSTATPAAPPDEAYPGIKMSRAEQVFVTNSPKAFYPLDCKARPDNAYKMARSLAVRQGYKLAAQCGASGP